MDQYAYNNRLEKDWNFTDRVHQKASDLIYKKNIKIEKATLKQDCNEGIDYWATTESGKRFAIQERFRTKNKFTVNSREFTLRYKRPDSISSNQNKSEFFKIKADMLLYGITNNESTDDHEIGFKRYVVVDLNELMRAIKDGKILIDENQNNNRNAPYLSQNQIYAVVKKNHEQSTNNSQLVIFNAVHVMALTSQGYYIIKKEDGYIKNFSNEFMKRKVASM